MKVYISVDMEGIGGISHSDPTDRGDSGYPAAVRLMVGEANAAIEGAYAGGATEVLVNDSHGRMFNLTPEDLDPRAVLLQGQKPWSMVAGAGPYRAVWAPVRTRACPSECRSCPAHTRQRADGAYTRTAPSCTGRAPGADGSTCA